MPLDFLKYVTFIGGILMFSACVDPITFKTALPLRTLVVEGSVTTGAKGNFVGLSRVTEYGKTFRSPVSGATVNFYDEAGNFTILPEQEEGIYRLTDSDFVRVPGNQYHIEIILPDGEIYRSQPEIMPVAATLDSMELVILPGIKGAVETYVNATLPEETVWLRFKVEEVYSFSEVSCSFSIPSKTCYITLPSLVPQTLITNDHNGLNKVQKLLVGLKNEISPLEFSRGRHYFNVYQYSSAQGAYEYWDKIEKLVNQSGSIFDAAPAALPGNVFNTGDPTEPVLGYFELANVDTLRKFVYPALARHYVFYLPDFCSTVSSQMQCCDCLTIQYSSINKPEWWPL